MAVTTTRKMPSFEGVALGSNPIARLPIGLTYHTLLLTYTNLTLSEVTNVRVNVNGRPIMDFASLAELDAWNRQRGRSGAVDAVDTTGVIAIDFVRYGMRTNGARLATGLGTGAKEDSNPVQSLNLECEIASATGSLDNPSLSLKAVQSSPRPSGVVKHVRRFPYPFNGSGEFEVSDLPRGMAINRMMVSEGGQNVTRLKLERDNFTVFERTSDENGLILGDSRFGADVSGYFVYDPTEDGVGDGVFETDGVNDLRVIPNFDAAPGSFDVLVEYAGQISG